MNCTRNTSAGFLCVLVACILLTVSADGRTWRVEREGGGDYRIIQNAVDVAASGDTILIGPGRYDDMFWLTCPGWSDSVIVNVTQHELTLMGSGPETIIGMADAWDPEEDLFNRRKGIVAGDYFGNHVLRVEKLRVENMRTGVYTSYESTGQDTVLVRNCEFYANQRSLTLIGDGGVVDVVNCRFDHMPAGGTHLNSNAVGKLNVKDCTFELWDYHPTHQGHISLMGGGLAVFKRCTFLEGFDGIVFSGTAQGIVQDCVFVGQRSNATYGSFANVAFDRCTFRDQELVFYPSACDFRFTNCMIESVSDAAFLINKVVSLTVNNCDLAGGERGVVWCLDTHSCGEPRTLDFSNNYWGTSDPDSIEALIRDLNDPDTECCYYIDYEPYRSDSTPVQRRNFGDIKALFR